MGCCSSKPQADERGATSNGQGAEVPTPPPQQQSGPGPKPAGKSPQVPSNEQPTIDKGPTSQEKVVLEVIAVSRHSSQQSVAEPARGSPQVGGASSYERPTTDLDEKGPKLPEQVVPPAVSRLPSQKNGTKGPILQEKVVPPVAQAVSRHPSQQSVAKPARPTMQERVVPPVARAVSRLPSQQNGAKPTRESSRVGGTSSYEQPTTNLDDRGPTSQERVVLPVARAVSRLPSQQNGTRPARELPNQVGGASSYERPTTNLDDRGLISQDQVVPPVARAISGLHSQQSGTKPARTSPQVGGASLYERSMVNVDDRGPMLQEWAVPPVARAVSRLPSQQSGTRPAHESPDQVGGTSSYGRPTTNLDDRGPTSREQAGPPVARTVSRLHSQQSGTNQAHESPQVGGAPSYKQPMRSAWATAKSPVSTVGSAPQKVDEDWPTLMPQGSGEKSPVAQSRPSKASSKRPATRRPLNSTVRQVLSEDVKFRILVVGKSGSGKSSLIKAIFKVDMAAAPERALGKADINAEFCPADNRFLIVHECPGLDSQASNSQDLPTIRDFITYRTDPSRSPPERLHAVWICIPASDAIARRIGDGVEEILGLRNVPVVVVFTKFDVVVSQVRLDNPSETHERARTRANTIYKDSCRSLFHKDPRDVPAEIVSEDSRFVDLIDNLTVTTDRFITDSRAPPARSGVQGAEQVGAVPLAWSAALRVNHDIIIRASIEVGRSQYWRSLWSSVDFADRTLKNCVNIIHADIVEIWNMNDKTRYLSSDKFKAKMSHLVKDLAVSANGTSGSDPTRAGGGYANWVNDLYTGSQENVRCVMGYIVDLTVILDGIFRIAAGDMSPNHAQQVLERHARSGDRLTIHNDIRSFITGTSTMKFSVQQPQKDLVLDEIIDLIKQFCVPPSGSGNEGNG